MTNYFSQSFVPPRALSRDLPIFDTHQPVRHFHDASVMRGKNKGRLEIAIDLLHQLQNAFTRLMIKIRRWLIGQYNPWLCRKRARNRYSLPLSAAKLVRPMPGKFRQPHDGQISGDPVAALCCAISLSCSNGYSTFSSAERTGNKLNV